jgi:hypothetical protein
LLRKALDAAGISYEYVSNYPEADKGQPWPGARDGETFVNLEPGGNEGYSLYVNVRVPSPNRDGTYTLFQPIRVKLLSTVDEALKAHGFVSYLFQWLTRRRS